uniref:Interleukin 22 receptor subunit alpha 2 n=1 Tax=Lepisosteus oculatus TaxID=7918 RepID=W5NEC8_LEPOC
KCKYAFSALLLCFSISTITECAHTVPEYLSDDEITPKEVEFHSVDYKNVLHWKLLKPLQGRPVYFVQYKIYGQKKWANAVHCLGITEPHCDLSQETSDRRECYYARVQTALDDTLSPWVISPRFVPQWETSLSAPVIKLTARESAILVQFKAPRSPYRRRNGSWISMKRLHQLTYRLYVMKDNMIQAKHVLGRPVRKILIVNLKPKTTYCVQAEAKIQLHNRTSKRSKKACVITL